MIGIKSAIANSNFLLCDSEARVSPQAEGASRHGVLAIYQPPTRKLEISCYFDPKA